MYLPPGYSVAACKDCTSHGGDVLLLCRDYLLVDAINCAEFYVDGSSEFFAVRFRNIAILCIYRQLSDSNITIIDSLLDFRTAYQLLVIIMGDFNVHHLHTPMWLVTPLSRTSPYIFTNSRCPLNKDFDCY